MNKEPRLSDYWINLLFLAIVVFLGNLWIRHHLSDSSLLMIFVNSIVAIYGLAYSFLGKSIGESGQNEVTRIVRKFFLVILKPAFLVILYILLIITASLYASVWIINNGPNESINLELSPIDSYEEKMENITITSKNEIIKKGYFTSPFGRVMTLRAKGFRDYSFVLYPVSGKKIMLNDALLPLPSLWIRMYPTIVNVLLDKCRLCIIDEQTLDTLFIEPTENTIGSYIIGEPQTLSTPQLEKWQREASAFYENEGPELSRTILKWNNLRYFNQTLDLRPNKSYAVKLLFQDNSVIGESNFILNINDLLIDVLLKQPKIP